MTIENAAGDVEFTCEKCSQNPDKAPAMRVTRIDTRVDGCMTFTPGKVSIISLTCDKCGATVQRKLPWGLRP